MFCTCHEMNSFFLSFFFFRMTRTKGKKMIGLPRFEFFSTLRFFSRSKNSRENTTQYKLHNSPFKCGLQTDFSNLNIHYSFFHFIPSFLIHHPASTTRFYSQVTLDKDHKSLVPPQRPCSETLISVHQNPRLFF